MADATSAEVLIVEWLRTAAATAALRAVIPAASMSTEMPPAATLPHLLAREVNTSRIGRDGIGVSLMEFDAYAGEGTLPDHTPDFATAETAILELCDAIDNCRAQDLGAKGYIYVGAWISRRRMDDQVRGWARWMLEATFTTRKAIA